VATYERFPEACVFIYDSRFELNHKLLSKVDPNYSNVSPKIVSRQFEGVSTEELDREFFTMAIQEGMVSLIDRDYPLHRPPLLGHSYINDAELLLKGVIEDLKIV
jgi:hypothetical protein